jgi:diadenylate cyclase
MPEFGWLLSRLGDLRAILDVLAVTAIIYWLLWVAQGTRATQLIRGAIIFLAAAYFVATSLDLDTLNWILSKTWPALVVAIPVIFQPELRRALEQLGHTGSWLRTSFPASGEADLDRTVDEVVRAAGQLARLRFGALVVIERETGLQDYADRGVLIDANLTRQLLINIFYPNSPLHDAATLIRGDRILAASVVLPLTDNISPTGQLGTRHRAGIGVTEDSDALAIVVSEESGQISVAHNGRLIRNLDQDRLRRVLRTLMRLDRPADRQGSNGRINFPGRAQIERRNLPGARRSDTEPSKSATP